MKKETTYAEAGVDYDALDPFKRAAQRAAAMTGWHIRRFGFSELMTSRGESAYIIETPEGYLAHVEEGLGTKSLVADEMYRLTGKSYYGHVAQCAVAMIVNDMITLGALPVSVAMHLAVGSSDWFADAERAQDLIDGWRKACHLSRCAWGGGETSVLKSVVEPGAAVIAGSAVGFIHPKERRIWPHLGDGDAIVLIGSSGIHANGLTLARRIADDLPDGYLTRLSDGRSYGEALLDPTVIYVPLIEDCLNARIEIRYAANITGHGWRKLMRLPEPFSYVIERLPEPQPVFGLIQEHGPVGDLEAYGNLNMGAGFALFVPTGDIDSVIRIATGLGMTALHAGHVRKSEQRKVSILPKGLEYDGSTLGVR